jgi:hypothetical protein
MFENLRKGLEHQRRPLTQHERDLIRWLLEHSQLEASRYLCQIDKLSVFEKCSCGCPTVYFALDGVRVARKGEELLSDWLAEVDGEEVGLMLFQTNNKISSLEVYSLAGTEKPFGLPGIESIHGY